jgi:hypothetical protein
MSMKYTFEYIDGITIVRFSEMPAFDEVRVVIDDLAKAESYCLRLWDFSCVDFEFSIEGVKEIAKYGKLKFEKKNFFAAVAPQDFAYGMLRVFEVYREEDGHSRVRIFRTEPEAIEWLLAQSALVIVSATK